LRTRLTDLLGIQVPIVQGAMQWLSRAPLAAAVSNAGGLGVITAKSFANPDQLRREIAALRAICDRPFAVNLSLLPELAGPDPAEGWIAACLAEGAPVVETAGRPPGPFLASLQSAGIKVMHKCPSVRHALSAQKAGVDAVTVVGMECGGHPGLDGVGSLVLARRAATELSIPLVVGGGVADGFGLAAALALGADGVVMGTRFLLARETGLPPAVAQRLLASDERSTRLVMQSLRNTARVLDNDPARAVTAAEERGADLEQLRPLISGQRGQAALMADDPEGGLLALGQCVGLVREVLPAAEIINQTLAEARAAVARLGRIMED
jgi:nitronate monooxygenase